MASERVVRWTVPARNDLVEAHSYLRERNPAAAAEFARRIRTAIENLGSFPRSGARLKSVPLRGEYRSLVLDYYRLIYRLDAEALFIMRIWDCRQDPDLMWDSLEK